MRVLRIHVLILVKVTNSMEQSPSVVDRSSTSQEIPRILWKSEVPYRIHNSPPTTLILSQINPDPVPLTYCLKIHFKITFPSTPRSSKLSRSLSLPHINPVRNDSFPFVLHVQPISLF
jgi:hypothetical protein